MPRLLLDVFLYALARLLLVAVIAGAIFGVVSLLGIRDFPAMVALLFALVLGMPLGIWLFAPLRRRATAGIAAAAPAVHRDAGIRIGAVAVARKSAAAVPQSCAKNTATESEIAAPSYGVPHHTARV